MGVNICGATCIEIYHADEFVFVDLLEALQLRRVLGDVLVQGACRGRTEPASAGGVDTWRYLARPLPESWSARPVACASQLAKGPGPAGAFGASSAKAQSKYFSASLHGAFSFHKVRKARLASTTLGLT